MITYRLRGLVNLHIAASAMLATGYFLLLAVGVQYLPSFQLSEGLNLLLYAVTIFVGMLVSGQFWTHFGSRFHVMTWIDAAHIASRQIIVVALLVFTLIVATKDASISRIFLASYLISGSLLLVIVNRMLPAALARAAFHKPHQIPTLFVGSARTVSKLNLWIHQKEHLGVRVVGLLTDDAEAEATSQTGPILGAVPQLAEVVEAMGIGQVILMEVPAEQQRLIAIIEACQASGCRLLIYHDLLERLPVRLMPVMEEQHLFLTAQEEPLEDPFNRAMKRLFDIAIALPVVIIVLPPLCFVVWLMQCIQARGPLLFSRARGGQRRQEFYMLKFRSMYATVEDAYGEAQQARHGDQRIYPFGAFLRKTSLDEFPQFWNVLMGDMSIVGPRPHLPQHDVEFSAVAKSYRTRQLVKPGITGLAQIRGYRGEITDPELLHRRIRADIEYITTWSLWLDVQITLKTLLHVLAPPPTAR